MSTIGVVLIAVAAFVVGAWTGITIMCMLAASGRADREAGNIQA